VNEKTQSQDINRTLGKGLKFKEFANSVWNNDNTTACTERDCLSGHQHKLARMIGHAIIT